MQNRLPGQQDTEINDHRRREAKSPAAGFDWNSFDAVIFDLDGTLVDSMWMWTDIDIEYLDRFGHAFDPQLQKDIEGMSIEETARYFQDTYNIPRSLEEIMGDWIEMSIDKYRHEVTLKPYAAEFLAFLRNRSLKTAIATSNSIHMVEACLEHLSIRDAFDYVVTSSSVERGKPYPDVYLHVAEVLGVSPARCLVFEDIPAGIQAGKAAGMTVIAVHDTFSEDMDDIKRELADGYINDFSELGI